MIEELQRKPAMSQVFHDADKDMREIYNKKPNCKADKEPMTFQEFLEVEPDAEYDFSSDDYEAEFEQGFVNDDELDLHTMGLAGIKEFDPQEMPWDPETE